jgi:hypothetical protein
MEVFMNKIMTGTIIATLLTFTAEQAAANSNGNNGMQHYSGTGQTNGFTSSTGFVKERNDEQNHMDGQDADSKSAMDSDEDAPEGGSTDATDATKDGTTKNDSSKTSPAR